MMTDLPLDLLACPSCRGTLRSHAEGVRCEACDAGYARTGAITDLIPADLRAEIAGKGTDRAWTRWNEAIRGLERWRERRAAGGAGSDGTRDTEVSALLDRVRAEGVVLDVGAKDGARAALLPPGARYLGIDPHPVPLASRPGGAALVRGVVEALPVRDRAVDTVLCMAAFDYFIDGPAALADMARVLRPGGRLAMLVSVVTPRIAHARGGRTRTSRVLGAVRAIRDVGAVAGAGLLAGALRDAERAHMHYYTRTQCLSMVGVRFEVESVLDVEQPTSTILYIAARKRGTRALPVLR